MQEALKFDCSAPANTQRQMCEWGSLFKCVDCHNTHNWHIASLIRNVLIEQIQLSELMRMKLQAVKNCSVQELYLSRCVGLLVHGI